MAQWKFGANASLELADPAGYTIDDRAAGRLARARRARSACRDRSVRASQAGGRCAGLAWHDDLGGMGAGYAAALGGRSVAPWDRSPTRRARQSPSGWRELGIIHDPIRVVDHPADWTLLITSGPFGDKLPIGFRGCHAALTPERLTRGPLGPATFASWPRLPNRLAARVLGTARRGHPILRAGDAEHARPRLLRLELRQVDRHLELQSPGMGNAGRPRGSRLASFDPGRDRRARGKLGALHEHRRRIGATATAGVSPAATATRHQPGR